MALIKDHGPSNWVRISQMLATRTPKQCRERYHQNLKPTLNHEPITDQEGLYIEQLVAQYGKKWAEIARHLNGRSDNAVKNWWNGGANRRRRASLAMEQQQSQPPQAAANQPQPQLHHPHAAAPPPPPHSAGSAGGGPGYMHQFNYYPTVGHRVSLPNIHSEAYHHPPPPGHHHRPLAPSHLGPYATQHQPYSQPQFSQPQPQSQGQQPPAVVFNSAYTDGSGGAFGRSTSSSLNSTVDPHQQQPPAPTSPRPEGASESNGSNTTNPNSTPGSYHFSSSRRRGTAHLDDMTLFPNTPYSRRVSINTSSTGYSSSRASSIGGISSASDNEDPLHSLSKYSLSNSTTTSRRNSAIPPINNDIPTTLPPLGGTGATNGGGSPNSSLFKPAYRQQQTPPHPQAQQQQPQSTSPSLAPPQQSYHRHSISGYPSSTTPGQSPTTGNFKLGGINEHASDSTTTPPPSTSTSGSPSEINEPSPVISTKPAEEKLKISNLLS